MKFVDGKKLEDKFIYFQFIEISDGGCALNLYRTYS